MRPFHLAAIVACLAPSVALVAQVPLPTVYTADPSHSLLDFTIRLVGFNRVRGTFGDWRADVAYDPKAPSRGYVAFAAEVSSIDTQVRGAGPPPPEPRLLRRHPIPPNRVRRPAHPRGRQSARARGRSGDPRQYSSDPPRCRPHHARGPRPVRQPAACVQHDHRPLPPRFRRRRPPFWSRAIADSVFVEIELAGRVWDYRSLGFGRKTAVYGPALVAAADSGKAQWSKPQRSNLEVRKGEILLRLGRPADARRALDDALTLDPSNTTARAWRWVVGSSARSEPP